MKKQFVTLFALLSITACAAPPELKDIRLKPGFKIDYFAKEVPNARAMALSPSGTLFVGSRREGKVYAITDKDGDYKADQVYIIDRDLELPTGVAFRDGSLYVAAISTILRYDNIESLLENPPEPVVVTNQFPSDVHHGWKFIDFGPDGKLYVPVGAPCNICESEKPIYASISKMDPDGSNLEIVAHGVRNTVGFAWHPETSELWFTDNGRDMLGDNLPPCELNRLAEEGTHFGYPYVHGDDVADPEFGKNKDLSQYQKPAQELGPHVAPLGMTFYTGDMFPAEYRNQILIAEHGSWNRSKKIGYRVMMVRLDGNKAVSYEPFAEGWLKGESVSGRPVDVLVMPDGSVLISDDEAGVIYRVTYEAP